MTLLKKNVLNVNPKRSDFKDNIQRKIIVFAIFTNAKIVSTIFPKQKILFYKI